jgi:hypothetical protein
VPVADAKVRTYGRPEDNEQGRRWQAKELTNVEPMRTTCRATGKTVSITLAPYSMNVVKLRPVVQR